MVKLKNGLFIAYDKTMVENSREDLSTRLLIKHGRKWIPRPKSWRAEGRTALSLQNEDSLTLVEKTEIITTMLELELNSHQENKLQIDQIDLIVTKIMELERLRPIDKRLYQEEIVTILTSIFKKSYSGDRLQMIEEAVQSLANDSNLKESIEKGMKSDLVIARAAKEPLEVVITRSKYEDVMEVECSRLDKDGFVGFTDAVCSVGLAANGRFVVSGLADNTIKLWSIFERKEEYTLTGHTDIVASVAISADCKLIVSGSYDKTIKLWRIQERKEEVTFAGHASKVYSVAFSGDCRFIVSGSEDKTIKMWSIQGRSEEFTFTGHTDRVQSVALSADGRFIVSGSRDNTIKLWDIKERREECTFTGHTGEVYSVAISADSRFIVSGSEDSMIKMWGVQEKNEEFSLEGHKERVRSVALSADGKFIASGSYDRMVKVWGVEDRREYFTCTGHAAAVMSVAVSADSRFIVSGSQDKTIKIWNTEDWREECRSKGYTDSDFVVSVDGRFLVTGSNNGGGRYNESTSDNTVKIWNIQERREEYALTGHTEPVISVAVSADGRFIVSGSEDTTVKLWNIKDRKEEYTFIGHEYYITSVAVSADGGFIASMSEMNIKIWNTQERKEEFALTMDTEGLQMAISADGRFIAVSSEEMVTKLWSIQDRREEFIFTELTYRFISVAMTPDSKFIVGGTFDGIIQIWSIQEKREEFTLKGHTGSIYCLAVSADGRFIISGASDNTVKMWNIEQQIEECTFQKYRSRTLVTVSADCRVIASYKDHNTIIIWRTQEWRKECALTGLLSMGPCMAVSKNCRFIAIIKFPKSRSPREASSAIILWNIPEKKEEFRFKGNTYNQCVAFSGDCSIIVSGSKEKTITIWSILNQREEYTFTGHTQEVTSVAVTVDDRFIVSGSNDWTIKLWNIQKLEEEFTFIGHKSAVASVIVSTDGRFIVSGSYDNTIKLWSIKERREEFTFTGHTSEVRSLAISADSRIIVSGSAIVNDYMIKVWNIHEQREECTFKSDYTGEIAVSPDGRFLLSGSRSSLKIYNIEERQREEHISIEPTGILAVSADGRFVVNKSDKKINVLDIKDSSIMYKFPERTNRVPVAMSTDGRFIVNRSDKNMVRIWNVQEHREECTFSDLIVVERIIISSNRKFIISKGVDSIVKIWNLESKSKERFSLSKHEGLMKYILELFSIVNCEVVATPDFLLLRYEFGIFQTILISDGNLQLSHDLGVNCSNKVLLKYSFEHYVSTTRPLTIIGPSFADQYTDISRFTLAHYFCFSGSASKLKLLCENVNFRISVDCFCKSPFYYAILKRRQDCVDLLIEKLEIMRLQNKANYEMSIHAIRNDVPLIIKNSPRQLYQLLLGLISSGSLIYAKIPGDLPILQTGLTPNPRLNDFSQEGPEEIPVVLQHSRVSLIGENGCSYNLTLLDAIINCKNPQGLRSPIIYYIVTIQFNAIRHWVIGYTALLCLNIILLMCLMGLKGMNIYLVIGFFIVNALLLSWEVIQMFTDSKEYLIDYWNWLDIMRNLTSVAWIILGLYGFFSVHFTWCVALLNLLRGIAVFRLFDGTRFYIELIFRSINDIKYFFIMFAYSTFTFGFLLMISRDQGLEFNSIWGDSYNLNFGNYEDTNSGIYFLQYMGYFGATVINVVLMLNLLISILGDSYERFQLEQAIVDIKEKARISMELQLMMFWANQQSPLKCIRLCNSAFQDEEEQDWEGRIRFMDKKLDKSIKELIDSNKRAETRGNENNKSITTEIKSLQGKFTSVESKISNIIGSLEGKVSDRTSMETKINDISQSLEGKINTSLVEIGDKTISLEKRINDISTSLEGKMNDISTSLDGKMNDISISLEGKMNDLNQKLESILNIISK